MTFVFSFPAVRQDTCSPQDSSSQNVGVAFGLVCAAGLATSIGAAFAFCMPYKTGQTNYFLAASLALAAGVMTYVSFVEIFSAKAVGAFSACVEDKYAYLYATLCFFGGILLCAFFDWIIHCFEHWMINRKTTKKSDIDQPKQDKQGKQENQGESHIYSNPNTSATSLVDVTTPLPVYNDSSTTVDPAQWPSNESKRLTDPTADSHDTHHRHHDHYQNHDESNTNYSMELELDEEVAHDGIMVAEIYENNPERARLIRMGIFAGVAIAFHNFPEGLATFVATLNDPHVGAAVAVAIGLHNIPEGICVAMPIYYATKSKWKAFFWATLSGISEILGAALGYAVLRKVLNQIAYGVLFGIVAGMMVYISLKELLPSAHRYDREDKVVTIFFIIGFAIMALSLVLFYF